MSPNVPQYVIAYQACAKLPAPSWSVDPLCPGTGVHHYVRDSGAETLIVMAAFAKGPIDVLKTGDTALRNVITFRFRQVPYPKWSRTGDRGLQRVVSAAADEPPVDVGPDDVLMLQYTGGTTGLSQGVRADQRQPGVDRLPGELLDVAHHRQDDHLRCLAAVPLYHIYGFNMNVNVNHVFGGTIILVPQPSTDNILAPSTS